MVAGLSGHEMQDGNQETDAGSYDTHYLKSLRHYLTRDVLPKDSHYRNLDALVESSSRPTLDELHGTNRELEKEVSRFFKVKPTFIY